jgi:hypothetical protein
VDTSKDLETPIEKKNRNEKFEKIRSREDYEKLSKEEQGKYGTWRRNLQGIGKSKVKSALSTMNRKPAFYWNSDHLSWKLIREDYDWLTPEVRSCLKDCFA